MEASLILKTQILVIGAGQAGLSAAYQLKQRNLRPNHDYLVIDQASEPGGAWQFRWPSLTLSTVNRLHDLPGMKFSDVAGSATSEVPANIAVPEYYAAYEEAFALPVYRPVTVRVVCQREDRFRVETDRGLMSARGIINATGTWTNPYIPDYRRADLFRGPRSRRDRGGPRTARTPAGIGRIGDRPAGDGVN